MKALLLDDEAPSRKALRGKLDLFCPQVREVLEASTVDENGEPGGIYTRRWTITDIGTLARELTVTVEWTRLGRTRSVQVTSNTRCNGA